MLGVLLYFIYFNELTLHVDNHIYLFANFMLELLTLVIVIAFNQIWTILNKQVANFL